MRVVVQDLTSAATIAVTAANNQTQRDLEAAIGCELSDSECLSRRGEEANKEVLNLLTKARHDFENTLGCPVTSADCLSRRAEKLSEQASTQAEAAAQGAARGALATVGCGEAADVEACLLRRAQELSVALSIITSTVVLSGIAGR